MCHVHQDHFQKADNKYILDLSIGGLKVQNKCFGQWFFLSFVIAYFIGVTPIFQNVMVISNYSIVRCRGEPWIAIFWAPLPLCWFGSCSCWVGGSATCLSCLEISQTELYDSKSAVPRVCFPICSYLVKVPGWEEYVCSIHFQKCSRVLPIFDKSIIIFLI